MSGPPSAFERLTALRNQSVELGLWQITRLLDRLDHPERDFPAIHVGGTNGKGSVCAMIAAQLQRSGHRVGLLTSPHLVDYSERIRVDGRPIRPDEADDIVSAMATGDGVLDGSFFEVTTALAFEHFRRRGVDVAVLEVGLGGRLDATNVCHPRVTVVTSIDLDHTKTLGADLATIAGEKAGIVKPGIPVVIGPMAEEARVVIELIAARRGAPVIVADEEAEVRVRESGWAGLEVTLRLAGDTHRWARMPLPGRHQVDNLLVAATAARLFDPRESARDPLLEGLADTHWPGRLARVDGNPVRVYDVAHNEAGARALAAALDELGHPPGSVLVLGVLGDKDLAGMVEGLSRHFRRAVATTPPHPLRARPAADTARALADVGIEVDVVEDVAAAVERAKALLGPQGWVFVTGSLFTVGAAMEAFGDRVDGEPAGTGGRESSAPRDG